MSPKRGLIIGLLAALVLSSNPGAENPLKPKLNLVPGESYFCSMNMNKRVEQTIHGEKQIMEQSLLLTWDYDILSINDKGNYRITARYKRIKTTQKFGMQTMEFDSDNMPDYIDPSMIGYKFLVGSELQMEVTPEGKVNRLEGFQEIIDKIIKELNIPDSPRRNDIINNLRGQFGDETMRKSFEQMTAFYPESPIVTGDTWHSRLSLDVGFPIVVESDYTLLSRKDGIADINVEATVRSNPASGGIDMGEFSLSYDLDGNQRGLIKMNEASGLPVSSDISQSFTGTVSVSNAPDLEEKSWPISADGGITITFEKQ